MTMSEWKPIETAPRDALILGHDDGMVRLIFWETGQWKQVGATVEAGYFMPTLWHPLPFPPETGNHGSVERNGTG